MKTYMLITVLVSMLTSVTLYAQHCDSSPTEISYDNLTSQFDEPPSWCREGASISFVIKNANPFALNSTMTVEMSSTKFIDGSDLFQKAIGITETKGTTNSAIVTDAKSALLYKSTTHMENDKKAIEDSLLRQKNSIIVTIKEEFKTAEIKNRDIKKIMTLDTITYTLMNNPDIRTKYEMQSRLFQLYGSHIYNISDVSILFQQKLDEINTSISKIVDSIESLSTINKKLLSIKSNATFTVYLDSLHKTTNALRTIYSGKNLESMDRKILDIKIKLSNIENSEFVIRGNRNVTLTGDHVEIGDTLKKSDGTVYKIIDPIKIRSYGGVRIDFSSGFATTLGKINGIDYYMRRDTAQNVIGIDSSTQSRKFNITPIAMINLTFKTKSFISPGVSIGINPDFTNVSGSKLLIGGSLALASTNDIANRVLLSGGIGIGYADQILPKYLNLQEFSSLNSLSDDQLSSKTLHCGWFISATLNLANLNANNDN